MACKKSGTNKKENPHERLVLTHTISSKARWNATKFSPILPPDSLDFALASTYNHHAVWGAAKGYVVKQERSCIVNHAVEFKKQAAELQEREDLKNYSGSQEPYRNNAFHVQLGIPPHHTSSSRRGYGRSSDGCFYSA
ncbi:unnamed protein product [Orchesella dallaii]|uniref:Uncharacterized protein n=1 Tax=Orchesella dallaii TaxID=48710 RepID=A0ABP1PUJ9_9HEXA